MVAADDPFRPGPSACPDPCDEPAVGTAGGRQCRFNEDRQAKTRRLDALHAVANEIAAGEDQQVTIRAALQVLESRLGYRRGLVMLLPVGGDRLVVAASSEDLPADGDSQTYRRGEGITGRVLENGAPLVIPDIRQNRGFTNRIFRRKTDSQDPPIAFICVPIAIGQEVVGTLSVDVEMPGSSDELAACQGVLAIVATMIAHDVAARRQISRAREQLGAENLRLRESLGERLRPESMVGNSPPMKQVYVRIHQVAPSDVTVLVRGESGTGKELVAAAIHYTSDRRQGPFVRVNCAALNENLLESELFGHVRGAFTGAVGDRQGRLGEAEGGTLFLDEIGEFSPAMQVKLLRVLQEREYQPVGSDRTLHTNARIVCATNRDLEAAVKAGDFRQDLYYRINVFPIALPPLRDRRDDVLLLANHFSDRIGQRMGRPIKRISTPAISMLLAYHWPGNVRELSNCIEHAVLLGTDGVIQSHHLPPTLAMPDAGVQQGGGLEERVRALECDLIVDALKRSGGNASAAARELGVTPRILRYKIKTLEIDVERLFAAEA